jgi:hypothetical protein
MQPETVKVTRSAYFTEIIKTPWDGQLHTGRLECWQYQKTLTEPYFIVLLLAQHEFITHEVLLFRAMAVVSSAFLPIFRV